MASLPFDFLLLVFRSLSKRDQIECMTVCRQWHDIILKNSLFRVIYIQSQNQLNKLIERVKKDPSLGEKAEKFKLKRQLDEDFDETIFVTLFPNLRKFILNNYNERNTDLTASFEALDDHPWCERMEKMVESSSDQMTKSLLYFGACNNLTYVSVVGDDYESGVDFVDALSSAPGLKTLKLSKYTLRLREFEKLHKQQLSLNSITLADCYIDCSFLPRNIVPATSVKSFDCISSELNAENQNISFLKYISKKYTELEELAFGVNYSGSDEEEGVKYRALISAYFKKLKGHLKTLSLSCLHFGDREHSAGFDWDVLDKSGCQLQELTLSSEVHEALLQELSMTKLAKSIQTLTVNRVVNAFNGFETTLEWKWLAKFKGLKDLTLYFPYKFAPYEKYRVDLAQVLEPMAKLELETLRLHDVEILFYPTDTSITYPSINQFFLNSGEIRLNSDAIISQCMPNLKHLGLDLSMSTRSVFMFPKTSFDYVELTGVFMKECPHVLLMTLDDNQRRLYTINTNKAYNKSERSLLTFQPLEQSMAAPYITVVCKSVSDFFVDRID